MLRTRPSFPDIYLNHVPRILSGHGWGWTGPHDAGLATGSAGWPTTRTTLLGAPPQGDASGNAQAVAVNGMVQRAWLSLLGANLGVDEIPLFALGKLSGVLLKQRLSMVRQ